MQEETHEIQRPDGTRLQAVVAGEGQSVLLVHGFSASIGQWNVVMPELLRRGHRVFAYDQRGHGGSSLGRRGCESQALFDDLMAVGEHFELVDVVLVGHSMGTFTCLGALADSAFRRRARAAVLISTETGNMRKGSPLSMVLAPLVRMGILDRACRNSAIGRRIATRLVGKGASEEILEDTRRIMASARPECRPFLDSMHDDSIADGLVRIDTPLHLILGEEDSATPLWHSQLVLERASSARLSMLPGVGHMVNWEAPEAIVASVSELAAAPGSDTPATPPG